jgi:hypothetical protein
MMSVLFLETQLRACVCVCVCIYVLVREEAMFFILRLSHYKVVYGNRRKKFCSCEY